MDIMYLLLATTTHVLEYTRQRFVILLLLIFLLSVHGVQLLVRERVL
jgi:hypothetical protein